MNLLTAIFSISALVLILHQAVNFSQVTACRQEAWLKSTELLTHQKLENSKNITLTHTKCKIRIFGNQKIAWKEVKASKMHFFNVQLQGKL